MTKGEDGEKDGSAVITGTACLIISDRQTSNGTSIVDRSIFSNKRLKCVFLERLYAIFQPRLPVVRGEDIDIPVSAPNLM